MDEIERTFRREHGRAVAVLVRVLGDIDLAEDAVQEAFVVAAERWPADGPPPSPAGWIITTARNRAIDRLRREANRDRKQAEAARLLGGGGDAVAPDDMALEGIDDRLRLIFTCCHPALNQAAQVALTLRLLGGLTTPEIARAFLVPETTMGQRLSRAKAKIRDARIPYRVPGRAELPERTRAVLTVVYLIYNAGYSDRERGELCAEAIRLGRLLRELIDDPEVDGLLGLMLLQHARHATRTDGTGDLVLLADQNRATWDRELITEGHALVRGCLERNEPGPFQVQAAIAAVHADARTMDETDWGQVVALYDQLLVFLPSPVVALNRAVAVAELDGPQVALALVDELTLPALSGYPVFHAVRADLLRRLDRLPEALGEYRNAAGLTADAAEQRYLAARAREIERFGVDRLG